MNILLISRCPPYPLHFGDRLIIWHLARELSQGGYTLDLLALTQYESDVDEIHHYAPFFRDVELFPETYRSPWMYLQRLVGSHYPQDAAGAWQTELWQSIEQRLSQNYYDLVHLFGGVHVYEFACLFEDIPAVITPYESYSLYLKRALQQNFSPSVWLSRQITRQFEKWMYEPYQSTVVLTEEDKTELLGINPHLDVRVIPNGIDLEDFQAQDKVRDKSTLLFVGNYEYPPNHDAALILARDIFPQVQAIIPDAKLQLVGNAPTDDMQDVASEYIEITGRVPRVQDYLASATVFVCPLRIGAGIKNKVLEALATGIPTIASPLSMEGISAIHGKHALIAEVDSMTETIVELLENQNLQQILQQNAPELIKEHYSWAGVTQQYEALYRTVIE